MKKLLFALPFIFLLESFIDLSKSGPSFPSSHQTTPQSITFSEPDTDPYIYFKANGVEPFWNITVSSDQVVFQSAVPGFEKFVAPHADPVKDLETHIKKYTLQGEDGAMEIEVYQGPCEKPNSNERFNYGAKVSIKHKQDKTFTVFNGCGLYITDMRLQHKWILDQIKGVQVTAAEFNDTLPFLELKTNGNSFTGRGGCNKITGRLFSERNVLRFVDLVVAKNSCPVIDKEKNFIYTLQFSTQYTIDGDLLMLSNPSGPTLQFKKGEL
jgi:heat shock protein HslJ/uncharacterized membrane protein